MEVRILKCDNEIIHEKASMMSIQKFVVFNQEAILYDPLSSSYFFERDRLPFQPNDALLHAFFQLPAESVQGILISADENVNECKWIPLRQALQEWENAFAISIMKIHGLLKWNDHYRFCSKCGGTLILHAHETEKKCEQCNAMFYPVQPPSVIVRIKHDDHILLARSPHYKPGMYALIAGFVEMGESLEEAVHREVKEETSLRISNVQYFGSQFWSLSNSFMIGFTADYEGGELKWNHELEDAKWFHRDELPMLPTTKSIAYHLIDDFRKGK